MNSPGSKKTNRESPQGRLQRGPAITFVLKPWRRVGDRTEPGWSLRGRDWDQHRVTGSCWLCVGERGAWVGTQQAWWGARVLQGGYFLGVGGG